FYWPAIAGAWQPHLGGGTPRDFGPCGDVLDRNAPLLFTVPLAEEGLLVPIYVRGKAVGTLWAIAHDHRRQFDSEDLRQLESFARFASAAYQAVQILHSEQSLETIINRIPFILTRCGQDLRYRFVSSSYAQMVGLQPSEITGKSLSEVIGEEGLSNDPAVHQERSSARMRRIRKQTALSRRRPTVLARGLYAREERRRKGRELAWVSHRH